MECRQPLLRSLHAFCLSQLAVISGGSRISERGVLKQLGAYALPLIFGHHASFWSKNCPKSYIGLAEGSSFVPLDPL